MAFLRLTSAIVLLPIFGYRAIPIQLKAALSAILVLTVSPVLGGSLENMPAGVLPVATIAIGEILTGLTFGLTAMLVMAGAEFGGSLIGIQMGFGIVNVLDPQLGRQVSIIGRLYYLLALVIFLILDLHLSFISALADTFKIIPIGSSIYINEVSIPYALLTAQIFIVAIKIAAPIMVMLFVTEVTLGILARLVPQMNVFIVGFPLKIGLGLFGLTLTVPVVVYIISKFFLWFESELTKIMILLGGG